MDTTRRVIGASIVNYQRECGALKSNGLSGSVSWQAGGSGVSCSTKMSKVAGCVTTRNMVCSAGRDVRWSSRGFGVMTRRYCSQATASSKTEEAWRLGMQVIKAIKENEIEDALELVEHNDGCIDFEAEDDFGSTALILAARKGERELCDAILAKDPTIVDVQNHFGSTALVCAATNNHIPVVEALIAKGANTNLRTRLGGSALIKAANAGNTEVCEILLQNGAVASFVTKLGATAADVAKNSNNPKLAEMLLKYHQKAN